MTKDHFIIIEALGGCWHEYRLPLDTPEGFFWLWERFQKHERWVEFWDEQMRRYLFKSSNVPSIIYFEHLINPLRFRDAVAAFFGWQESVK